MDRFVKVLIPLGENTKEELKMDESAVGMPVTANGEPIGFIGGVSDKMLKLLLWTKDWSVIEDENGEVEQLEILDPYLEDWNENLI